MPASVLELYCIRALFVELYALCKNFIFVVNIIIISSVKLSLGQATPIFSHDSAGSTCIYYFGSIRYTCEKVLTAGQYL